MRNVGCSEVVLSDSAYRSVVAEVYENVATETGGIFLGHRVDNVWYVIAALDPGPSSIFTPTYFEYDTPYVNHLANKIARLYEERPELLGLWHRHPGSFDSFSATDDGTNLRYVQQTGHGAISGLINLDPDLRLTMYYVSLPLVYTHVPVRVGNHLIPKRLLAHKILEDFVPTRQRTHFVTQVQRYALEILKAATPHSSSKLKGNEATRMLAVEAGRQTALDARTELDDVEATPTAVQEAVLKMLDVELQYLENQRDYECRIMMQDNRILISMTLREPLPQYPPSIDCVLSIDQDNRQVVEINGNHSVYESGALRMYLANLVNSNSAI